MIKFLLVKEHAISYKLKPSSRASHRQGLINAAAMLTVNMTAPPFRNKDEASITRRRPHRHNGITLAAGSPAF